MSKDLRSIISTAITREYALGDLVSELRKYRGCKATIKSLNLTRDELTALYHKSRVYNDRRITTLDDFLDDVKREQIYFRGTKLTIKGEKP